MTKNKTSSWKGNKLLMITIITLFFIITLTSYCSLEITALLKGYRIQIHSHTSIEHVTMAPESRAWTTMSNMSSGSSSRKLNISTSPPVSNVNTSTNGLSWSSLYEPQNLQHSLLFTRHTLVWKAILVAVFCSLSGYRYLGDSGTGWREILHDGTYGSWTDLLPFWGWYPPGSTNTKFWPFDRKCLENSKSQCYLSVRA